MLKRIKQIISAFTSDFTPIMENEIRAMLSPAELKLFLALDSVTKCHSYRVYQELQHIQLEQGQYQLLMRAALLHDLGKINAPITVWDRIAYVILAKLVPKVLAKLDPQLQSQWPALYAISHHPEIGAHHLQRIEADTALVHMVLNHHNQQVTDPLLKLLMAADELH